MSKFIVLLLIIFFNSTTSLLADLGPENERFRDLEALVNEPLEHLQRQQRPDEPAPRQFERPITLDEIIRDIGQYLRTGIDQGIHLLNSEQLKEIVNCRNLLNAHGDLNAVRLGLLVTLSLMTMMATLHFVF